MELSHWHKSSNHPSKMILENISVRTCFGWDLIFRNKVSIWTNSEEGFLDAFEFSSATNVNCSSLAISEGVLKTADFERMDYAINLFTLIDKLE